MDFIQAKNFFDELAKYGSIPGLEAVKALLFELNNPQDGLKVIHVAGTNGKGSTIAYIESIIKEAGYKTGVYTSPVVFDYFEKIRINGVNISEKDFIEETGIIKNAYEKVSKNKGLRPTVFEAETAMAFDYFNKEKCDYVIIETGMGGTLDATNVCKEVVCAVITSISMDHMNYLGNTLEEIACNKAGIIKESCPCVIAGANIKIKDVFISCAKEKHSSFIFTDKPEIISEGLDGTVFNYKASKENHYFEKLEISLIGTYQTENAALAIETALCTGDADIINSIPEGLKKAEWKGRFEKINNNPLVFIDGAHNPGAAERLKEIIENDFKDYKIIYIMGVLADKDYEQIIKTVIPYGIITYTITPHNIRALQGDKLCEVIKKRGFMAEYMDNYEDAIKCALNKAQEFEVSGYRCAIIAFGSLSYLGEIKKITKQITEHIQNGD